MQNQNQLPGRPNLDQLKKQAKELVKGHRAQSEETFRLIREFLPSLAKKSDEDIFLYPFGLHDGQSVIARQYGFVSWGHLRDEIESGLNRLRPEPAIEQMFRTICKSKETQDYKLYASIMNEGMLLAVPEEKFLKTNLDGYLKAAYTTMYMGELVSGMNVVYFWRISAPGQTNDLLARMAVRDDLVSGMLFSGTF